MSATCQRCGGKSDLFLCPRCVVQLREILMEFVTGGTVSVKLPDGEIVTRRPQGLLYHLEQAAIGQVKLGGGGRGSTRCEPFVGEDETLGKCVCKHGEKQHSQYYVSQDGNARQVEQACTAVDVDDEIEKPCHCRQYEPRNNQAKIRAQLLSAGRVNARASERLDAVRNTVTTTKRHLEETRGIVYVRAGFIGPLLAGHVRAPRNTEPTAAVIEYLIENVHSIACDETAKETFAEIEGHQKAIERIVNRPEPKIWLTCLAWNDGTRKDCGAEMYCREGTIEVTCPKCRMVWNVNRLQLRMEDEAQRKKLTISDILKMNRRLPEDRQISERTLRRWRKPGPRGEPPRLKAFGYRCPDGSFVINRHSPEDEELYRWCDITRLRSEKPKTKAQ